MHPKVSVVVPIYCVEKYLHQCVDSLLVQTLKDIEIILVDDGSPDRSGEIADRYAHDHKRIQVVHQSNAGLGPARNAGMGIATGEYIGFVDSDDWVKPEMYERLYEAAVQSDADIAVSGHCDYTNGKAVVVKQHPLKGNILANETDILSVRKELYGKGVYDKTVEAFPMSVCMSIYRREMVQAHNLRFSHILSEDRIFNLHAYKCAKTVCFTDNTDYCYRKEGQTSITQTFSHKKKQQYQEIMTTLVKMAQAEEDPECVIRAKRMAIDYCRLYVLQADNTADSFAEKCRHIKAFAQTREIAQCWQDYPIEHLPIQQSVFHWMILHEHYGAALVMNRFRQALKKGVGMHRGKTK